jgi:hypothetical protein
MERPPGGWSAIWTLEAVGTSTANFCIARHSLIKLGCCKPGNGSVDALISPTTSRKRNESPTFVSGK